MSKKNKIAVILASYNGGKYIKEQIDSILNQESVLVDIIKVLFVKNFPKGKINENQ